MHGQAYGAPTGARLTYRILADCAIRDDAVYDEWLVRDQSAVVRQMGFDLVDWTRGLIAREGGPERCVRPMTPANDVEGPYKGRGNTSEWGERLADTIRAIMSADMDVVPRRYDRAVSLFNPGGQDAVGWSEADRFWMGLRAAFPSAEFRIEHVIGREDPLLPPRAEVYIMGMSHAECGPSGRAASPPSGANGP